METTNLRIQKQIIRATAEVIIRQELSKVQFDIKYHKKVLSFLKCTIFFGAFWTWCSSSPESNYIIFINEHEWTKIFFVMLPLLLMIWLFVPLIVSTRNHKRKIEFEYHMTEAEWNTLYQRFILSKLGFSIDINNIKQMKTIYEKHDDISFYKCELVKFLESFYHEFKVDLSFDFFDYLADIILIGQDLKGKLVSDADEHYIFVVEKNSEFIYAAAFNGWKMRSV